MNILYRALGATLAVAGASFASASVLFFDDFEADTPATNQGTLVNWNVTRAAVDVVANGQFGLTGDGNFLDMDGSASSAGKIETKSSFNMVDGQQYLLTFRISGNQRNSAPDTMNLSIGSLSGSVLNVNSTVPWSLVGFGWTQAGDMTDVIEFDHLGGDNIGLLLDDVKLEAVPEPATMAVLGLGLAALARRKKSA